MDLTLALTVHRETYVAVPTLHSAAAALGHAKAAGLTYQFVVGFDDASDATRETIYGLTETLGLRAEFYTFNNADQGLTRNRIAQRAVGTYLAFLDADDLFSENWLTRAVAHLRHADQDGRRVIAHPEVTWQFGGAENIQINCSSDDPFFSPAMLSMRNYYDALCVARTDTYLAIPFASRSLEDGFAHEDHQWVVETWQANFIHEIVRDTIIFKRRQSRSQSRFSREVNAMIRRQDALRIDRLVPPAPEGDTSTARRQSDD